MSELKPCPFCGGECYWCDNIPDEDGDIHECDHIICSKCKMDITSIGEITMGCETVAEAKIITARLFNTRALTPKQQCADELVEMVENLKNEIHSVIGYVNSKLKSEISCTDLDEPDYLDEESVYLAELLLEKARGEL